MMTHLVVTLLGPDRPGLVDAVAETVAARGGNWLESRMAHLAGKFAGILRVEIPEERSADLESALADLQTRGLKLVVERATPTDEGTTPMRTVQVDLVGQDRQGIVREIAQLFAKQGVNVEDLVTERKSAPMSGERLFQATARVQIPSETPIAVIRAGLEKIANDLMVEIKVVENRD